VIFVLIILAAMLGLFLLDEYYKKRYVVVYLLICSLSGSLTVMSVKGVSTAVILTLSGEQNAFTHLLPWILVVTLTVTAVIQVPCSIIAHGCSSARA
jgi:magnesium transporter